MAILCIDIETTGCDPAKDAVIEIGLCHLRKDDRGLLWTHSEPASFFVRPPISIPSGASAVHHIVDADVADALPLSDALPTIMVEDTIYAAHKASFEQSFLPGVGPFICTWRVAVTLAPNAPGHSLQELRYWLKLDVNRYIADRSHRAGPDAYVCAALLARILNSGKMTVGQMMEISAGPVALPKLHFGKYVGVPVREVPLDYWEWCLRQDMEPDVLHTARVMLGIVA